MPRIPSPQAQPPRTRSLARLRSAAADCTACDLHKRGSQTVFGEGRTSARILFVGEQPGDQEDKQGKPFVGPAGRLFDEALEAAGIRREDTYVTNAVKHFKWEPAGARRIHAKPNAREIHACKPWLEAEIDAVRPEIIVCLGATAAQTLLGRRFRVTEQRGHPQPPPPQLQGVRMVIATVHPSSILRVPVREERAAALAAFIRDLKVVGLVLERTKAASGTAEAAHV